MPAERRPPFADVPRRWLNIAAVVGGLAGLLLSQAFGWSDVQTFVVTLGIAGVVVALTVWLHRLMHRPN
jgi:ribose/xylose/arabinose/galactoside ABC-type transport system permease subunit